MIQVEVEKSRVPRRPSTTWEEDSEIKTLEYVFSDLLLNMNFSILKMVLIYILSLFFDAYKKKKKTISGLFHCITNTWLQRGHR